MAQVIEVGPFGGCGGDPFETGAADRLLEIKIRYGAAINGMTIWYREGSGEPTRAKCGGGGGKEDTIIFKDEEFLTGMTAYVGPFGGSIVVRSLSFDSNRGKYGPYGPEVGTPFTVPVAKGKIVGFFGRARIHLDAIGVKIAPNVDASGVEIAPNVDASGVEMAPNVDASGVSSEPNVLKLA